MSPRGEWIPSYPGLGPGDSGAIGADIQRRLLEASQPDDSVAAPYDSGRSILHTSSSVPSFQISSSPPRPNLARLKPPPVYLTTKPVLGSPTATIVPVHATKLPPLHPELTIVNLPTTPSRMNLKRDACDDPDPSLPSSRYETPKPRGESTNFPGSAFLPKYTPAAVPTEAFLETLVPLPTSPLPEDQYEVTDWEQEEADEEATERKRMQKNIPAWCIGWIETAKTQTSIDPETVFGTQLPKCDLEVIFGPLAQDSAYLRARKGKRGSSGEWGLDRISKTELEEYRFKMGHTQQLEEVVIVQKPIEGNL